MFPDLTILGAGHLILGALLSVDILLHKHKPVSSVLWLAVVWGFPYGGTLAYLGFGIDRVRRGGADRAASRQIIKQRAALVPTFEHLAVGGYSEDPTTGPRNPAAHILRATDPAVQKHRVFKGNCTRFLVDGDQFYPALFEAIENAQSSVHLQTFILRRDHVGHELRELLIERARAGVKVRVLYDRFGSTFAHFSNFFRPARAAGVRAASITQANPLKGRFQINLRNHRKIAVIDGQVGFVGGINIHDDNSSTHAHGLPIRDYHVELKGPAVSDLQLLFFEDWYFATREPPEQLMQPHHFPSAGSVGEALVQIVPGAPEHFGRGVADAFFAAIVAAERSIVIVTPYFIPDEPIVHALRYAGQRGVDVKLIVPQRSNHWYTDLAARSQFSLLLEVDVRIFERRPPFIHAKALLVDGVYAMLGSANLDYRSLHLNFETNIEVVDETFVGAVAHQLDQELAQSTELHLSRHQQRPLVRRLAESFCYLFQPML